MGRVHGDQTTTMFMNSGMSDFFGGGNDFFARRQPTTRRPQTARSWHEQQHDPYSTRERQMRQQQQRRQELLRQRQAQEAAAQELAGQKRLVAQKLYSFGFTNLEQIKAALDECGPDVNACVRWLMGRERQARQRHDQAGSYTTRRHHDDGASSSPPHSPSEPSSPSSAPESLSRATPSRQQSDVEMSQSDTESESESEAEMDCDEMSPEAAAAVLQAMVRGHSARRDMKALARCTVVTDAVQKEAAEEESKWEPWVLMQQFRECKMLGDVPVDLIAYEEALLRLQMKLDNIQAGVGVSQDARQAVRGLRREVVRQLQQRLDRIDACKQWWQSKAAAASKAAMEAEPIEVA